MKKIFILITLFLIVSFANAQWVQMSNGMGTNKNVWSLATSGDNIFAGTNSGVYISTNNGVNWSLTSLNNQSGNVLLINGNNIYTGTYNGVFNSTNNGQNWEQIGLENRSIWALTIHGNNIFAGTDFGHGVYRSTNNRLSWTQTSLGDINFISSLVMSGNNVFAGDWALNSVFLSSDTGNTWTQISLGGTPTEVVLCLAVKGNFMFAGVDNGGVFRSSNSGFNWAQTSLSMGGVTSFAIKDNYIFASDFLFGEVYLSSNNGTSWELKNQGLSSQIDVWSLTTTSQYVFAGTDSSVWRRSFTEIIGIQKISELVPSSFSLSQNYPNPFNPVTKIRFELPKSSFVKLIVYDILGREVVTLVNEKLPPALMKLIGMGVIIQAVCIFIHCEPGILKKQRKCCL
ncbi:hypothetical protein ACFLSV_01650 [Bacteroidota bacterium]